MQLVKKLAENNKKRRRIERWRMYLKLQGNHGGHVEASLWIQTTTATRRSLISMTGRHCLSPAIKAPLRCRRRDRRREEVLLPTFSGHRKIGKKTVENTR